jgi:hypothetical protein
MAAFDIRTSAYLKERARAGLHGMAKTNQRFSRTIGVHESDGSRIRNVDPGKRNPYLDVCGWVHAASIAWPDVNPNALITPLISIARQGQMLYRDLRTLLDARDRETGRVVKAAAEVDRLRWKGDPLELADAIHTHANTLLHLESITRAIASHPDNPEAA